MYKTIIPFFYCVFFFFLFRVVGEWQRSSLSPNVHFKPKLLSSDVSDHLNLEIGKYSNSAASLAGLKESDTSLPYDTLNFGVHIADDTLSDLYADNYSQYSPAASCSKSLLSSCDGLLSAT